MRLLCVFFIPGLQICMIMSLVVWARVEHCFTSREQCFTHFHSLLNQSQGPIKLDSNPGLCKNQRDCVEDKDPLEPDVFFTAIPWFFPPGRDRGARSSLVVFHSKTWQQQALKYCFCGCPPCKELWVVWNLLDAYFDGYEHLSRIIPRGIKSLKNL